MQNLFKKILDESLRKHLLLETLSYQPEIETFQKSDKDRELIFEKRGILPQLDKYVDYAIKAFSPSIQRANGNIELAINENVFRFIRNRFFDKINVLLFYNEIDDEKFKYSGSTIQGKLNDGKKIANAIIRLYIKSSKENFIECFKIAFSHELLHIFDNYSRLLNNSPTLQQAMIDDGYSKYSNVENSDETIIELKMIKYYLSKFEMPAFIHGLKSEVEDDLLSAYTADDILKIVQKSRTYKYYLTVSKLIKKYYNIENKTEQKQILQIWNSLSIEKFVAKDFQELKKILKKRYLKSFHEFQNKTIRTVVDVIRKQNLTATRSPDFPLDYSKLEKTLKNKLKDGRRG